jgi:hypothetical protein
MAAAACRRSMLHHHLWQQRAWPGPGARSISQLVKTNGRRAFIVDTLALVRRLASLRFPRMLPLLSCPPVRVLRRPRGVR